MLAGRRGVRLCLAGPTLRRTGVHGWLAALVCCRPVRLTSPSVHACTQVPVRLLPLCESAGSRHHSHLLFASELDSSTTALEVGGTHFRQSAFPRLRQGEATLACSPVAGGLLLQVTTQVRVGGFGRAVWGGGPVAPSPHLVLMQVASLLG